MTPEELQRAIQRFGISTPTMKQRQAILARREKKTDTEAARGLGIGSSAIRNRLNRVGWQWREDQELMDDDTYKQFNEWVAEEFPFLKHVRLPEEERERRGRNWDIISRYLFIERPKISIPPGMEIRFLNVMQNQNIRKYSELAKLSTRDFMLLRGVGRHMLKFCNELLRQRGLKLQPSEVEPPMRHQLKHQSAITVQDLKIKKLWKQFDRGEFDNLTNEDLRTLMGHANRAERYLFARGEKRSLMRAREARRKIADLMQKRYEAYKRSERTHA